MDHTPATPAVDDRPIKLLDRTPVSDDHKKRLFDIVRAAQAIAVEDGRELQAEFGKEAVALIVGCNQFVRLFRGGASPGVVEFLLDEPERDGLQEAGYSLGEPEGMIFKMFGWKRLDPMEGAFSPLEIATRQAYQKAAKSGETNAAKPL